MSYVSLRPRFAGGVKKSRAHRIQSAEITHSQRLGAWSSGERAPHGVLQHSRLWAHPVSRVVSLLSDPNVKQVSEIRDQTHSSWITRLEKESWT